MRRVALALLILAGCHRYEVPLDQWLWRLDGAWKQAPGRADMRLARGTIIVFRNDHEYVELHCWLLERADETVYISSNSPRITTVGDWQQNGGRIRATRKNIAVAPRFAGKIDPFCVPLVYTLSGKSVSGDASGKGPGLYAPVTRLVAPDFEYYVKEARNSPLHCPAVSN
jgi:hypothetical protein